jgi:[acyl-carrier-protein] S-malonyltransferase
MREAGEKSPGSMAAVLGMDVEVLRAICAEATAATGRPLVVANDNCPGQTVISGDEQAMDYALPLVKARGAKRAVKLAVSVAAHSPLMGVSSDAFRQAVERTPMTAPQIPVIGNISAQPMTSVSMIRDELSGQLTSPVRWTESIQLMINKGVRTFVELGPKAVLVGLIKRIDPIVSATGVENPAQLAALLED